MSFFSCLYWLFIEPIKILLEAIYSVAFEIIKSPGITIIFLSLAVNFLALPLYKRADAIQEEQFQIQQRMKKWTDHIKKTFKGDERFMMLQTYYRQNNYKPTDTLKSSISLLLQIPLFMAAYDFLSNLYILKESSFGLIVDLSKPDGMLVIGGLAINILPILMTVFNIISTVIYTKGKPIGTKIQAYVLAALFLVLLYNSPSGLAFYWMLNNVFSLLKNIVEKIIKKSNFVRKNKISIKSPGLPICIISSVLGIVALILQQQLYFYLEEIQVVLLRIMGVLLQIPMILFLINKLNSKDDFEITKREKMLFLFNCIFMAILTGLLIPSAVIHASPQEFIDFKTHINPFFDVLESASLAFGFFVIWLSVFYYMFKPKAKRIMGLIMIIGVPSAIVNYMFYGKNYGIISSELRFESGVFIYKPEMWINFLTIIVVSAIALVLWKKKTDFLPNIVIVAGIALVGMSGYNIISSNKIIEDTKEMIIEQQKDELPKFTLSRNGKNVVVLMMDRAISSYLPYAFAEKPELQKQFEGFTYYPNTISYGGHTKFGVPGIYGGYDYIPIEMNKSTEKSMEQKHNEALLMLPELFSKQGAKVTIFDPPYAGYGEVSDLSIYDKYENVNAYNLQEIFNKKTDDETGQKKSRPFFSYSIFKISPVAFHEMLYNKGQYTLVRKSKAQTIHDLFHATGKYEYFFSELNVIESLDKIGNITDDNTDTLFMMDNMTTHAPVLLQLPEYKYMYTVNNENYSNLYNNKPSIMGGEKIDLINEIQITHYHANMAIYIALGKWMDYLKENNVYDNTKIIIVSDHGFELGQFKNMIYDKEFKDDCMFYNPLLLVKDFNSSDKFKIDNQFMTNADVPTFATDGVIDNPVNPFTENPINSDRKEGNQYILASRKFGLEQNNDNTFLPDHWFEVHGDARDISTWKYAGNDILPDGLQN